MNRAAALILTILMIFVLGPMASAKSLFPFEARMFAGSTTTSPADVNAELSSDGLKKVAAVSQYGLEIDYPLARFFHIGVRYTHRFELRDETQPIVADYFGEIDQDSLQAVARLPLWQAPFFRLDGFAAYGGSNTTLQLHVSGQDGEYTRGQSPWFSAPIAAYGGSISLGYKYFYLVVELGYEANKVTKLKTSGNVSGNLNSIDLSGSYFTVGLLFDGTNVTHE